MIYLLSSVCACTTTLCSTPVGLRLFLSFASLGRERVLAFCITDRWIALAGLHASQWSLSFRAPQRWSLPSHYLASHRVAEDVLTHVVQAEFHGMYFTADVPIDVEVIDYDLVVGHGWISLFRVIVDDCPAAVRDTCQCDFVLPSRSVGFGCFFGGSDEIPANQCTWSIFPAATVVVDSIGYNYGSFSQGIVY